LNLPNQITTARLVLAVILFVLLETACRGATSSVVWLVAFVLYVVTVLTDGLDGYLARARGQITAFGRITDPLADKIVICGVLVLTSVNDATRRLVPAWIVLAVLGREFLVSGLRGFLEGQGTRFGARWEGKAKLVLQAVYCGAVLFYPATGWGWVFVVARILLWAALVVTAWSAVVYVRSAAKLIGGAAER
jgi:CDP-diacylglycerol--glycerol-3-phosphate 3-phosphatidyltransferase